MLANLASGDELVPNDFSRIHGSGMMRETTSGPNDIISEEGSINKHYLNKLVSERAVSFSLSL
jgi:hypothetical protein